jgi:beta-glucanase (GH16 family)
MMRWRTLTITVHVISIVAALVLNGCSNSTDSKMKYHLVWSDEFDGPAGQKLGSNKWGYDIGTDWGNAQLEYDTDRAENVSLDGNGNLAIVARKENYQGQAYTSARIVTRGLFEPKYGRIEARIKLPTGRGIWPAFWMLGNDINTVGWPQCGEIDIMEYQGQKPKTIHGSLHGPGYSGGNPLGRRFDLASGRFDSTFHTFAVEWKRDRIDWFVDQQRYLTVLPEHANGEWVYDHPFFIILNVAVGGHWVGSPDSNTAFPQTMLVDYVRVYAEE